MPKITSNLVRPKLEFTMLDNHIICDTRLSNLAVRLYAFIMSVNDEWMFSIERLSKIFDTHTQTISKALQNLEEFGYFERRFENLGRGKGKVAIYYLFSYEEAKNNLVKNSQDNLSPVKISPVKISPVINSTPYKENQSYKEKNIINIRERERAREEKESFVINDNLNSYDYLQLQIKEKANMIFKLKCENEFLSYDEWEKWCFYRQAISKLDIVSLEFVLAENIKDLNAFGEKANESIALTISGGYKKPLLPKSNAPTPSVSQNATQGTSTSTGKGELKEWQITSGIHTAPNWKLLRPSDTIMMDAYTGKFLDYKEAFFAIRNANLGDYALDKYKTNGMPEWEREVREYLNIAIDERIAFLKKQKEEKEKIAV